MSLALTSVSSNTILSSTGSIWTFIIGLFIGIDRFNVIKLMGVLLTFGGVLLVSLIDSEGRSGETLLGDILSLVSAMTYAIYVTAFKKLVKNEDRVDNSSFLGVGVLLNEG